MMTDNSDGIITPQRRSISALVREQVRHGERPDNSIKLGKVA
jgi:hypothetical protein